MIRAVVSGTGLAGIAAGIPYVAHRPSVACEQTPLVIVLHMMDAALDESAMAAALPLACVPAWRAYLGLPMSGPRIHECGPLLGPVVERVAQELPGAVAGLREQLPVAKGPVVLVGASAGAAAVLLALAEGPVPVRAAVLIRPAARTAERLDFVNRASDIASRLPQPGVLIVSGDDDDAVSLGSAEALYHALSARWWSPAQIEQVRVPQLWKPLAVDQVVSLWLSRRLAG